MVATNCHRVGRHREEEVEARDHVDAGGDHRRRVDQRADGSRARHRIGEPYVERNLRRFAGRAEEEKQRDEADQRESEVSGVAREQRRVLRDLARDERRMPDRIEAPEQRVESDDERPVADAIDDECLVAGGGVRKNLVPEADQRERAEPDALPSDEHQQQVVAEHQDEHREGEQVEPSEEAPVRLVVVHVAGRVDVDEAADAGDDQRHDHRERVEPERDIDVDAADVEPWPHAIEHEAAQVRKREHPHEAPSPRGGTRR